MSNLQLISAAAGALLTLSIPAIAHADLTACGNVWLFGAAECKFVPTEECTTTCEPVAMEISCAARLYAECDASCTATAEAGCTETCQTSCGTTCDVTQTSEEPPNSMGLCMSSCQMDCNDACGGADNGECRSTCAHNCGEKCEQAKCKDDDTAIECVPKCVTSCAGSCWATASSDCQITCQAEQYSVCKTELVDRCHEECDVTGGAIFCDGQFLNAADIQACADEIEAEFSVHLEIKVEAEAEAEVDANGKVFGCSVDGAGAGLAGFMLALGLFGVTRRRRFRA